MANDIVTSDGEIIEVEAINAENASLAIGLTRAEIDQQIATAHQFPRSVSRATQNTLSLVTIDEEAAAECQYSLPRGNKPVVGPSIRLAEIVSGQWGNNRVSARVVHIDRAEKVVEAEGIFHDLETNAAMAARVRRRIVDKSGRLFNDDMIIMTGNAACAIARRNAILSGVPKAVWRKAFEAAQATVKGEVKTLSERRDKMLKAFGAFGVKPEQIFAAIDVGGIDDIALDHMPVLTGMHQALKTGEASVEEMFVTTVATGASAKQGLGEKLGDVADGGKGAAKAQNGTHDAGTAAKPDPEGEGGGEPAATAERPRTKAANDTAGAPAQDAAPADANEGGGNLPEPTSDDIEHARDRGWDAFQKGMSRKTVPGELRAKGREAERDAWLAGFDAAAEEGQGDA